MQELSKIENKGILSKVSELKIRDLKNFEPIKEQLRRVFTLISLKTLPDKNRPQPEVPSEEEVLLNFIYKHYSGYHPSEIFTAFEMAITRKWEIDNYEQWINHYQDFSCEYFARIMKPYYMWRKDQITKEMQQTPTQIEPPKPLDKFSQLIRYWNLSLTTGSYQIPTHIAINAFTELEKLSIINISVEEKKALFEDGKVRQDFLNEKRKTAKGFIIERNLGQFKAHCRALKFKEWATEKLFEEYNLETNIKERL